VITLKSIQGSYETSNLFTIVDRAFGGCCRAYDFRASDAYSRLSTSDKQRLEQVHRDLVLLWGALEMFADDHDEDPPATLDELVPKYLAALPSDPFATQQTASEQPTYNYSPSRGGLGYRYKKGAPGNRAWIVRSVGLPDFPYRGNGISVFTFARGRGSRA
jgi:hypothetical protein